MPQTISVLRLGHLFHLLSFDFAQKKRPDDLIIDLTFIVGEKLLIVYRKRCETNKLRNYLNSVFTMRLSFR